LKFHVKTYGCQMNERDTEAAEALLLRRGHVRARGEADAQVILVNTCSVRAKAEDKALGKLGLLVAGKREHPSRIVGVIGCMAERLGAAVFEEVPGLDFALGTRRLGRLPGILERVQAGQGPLLDVGGAATDPDVASVHTSGAISAFVTVLQGCDRRCSYCVVPRVRGAERSRPADEILSEVAGLAAAGVKEVTLLGQSVMSYGRREPVWPEGSVSPGGYREPFARLLEAVSAVSGIARVRFTSGHPSGCTPELVRAMRDIGPVCEHLHLPLQSGSDRILRLMRRGYATDDYRQAVDRLREAVPDLALTTDVIVGFPSESLDDFEATRRFCGEMEFDNAFIFKYSSRPGTPAAEIEDDVLPAEKMRRNKILLAEQDARGLARNERRINAVEEVLAEGPSLRNRARWSGRSRGNKIVIFNHVAGVRAGDRVRVRIERAGAQTLYGRIV
jgi:tRNA-2-methylthio-N6-dimethylallyladenosine synthase